MRLTLITDHRARVMPLVDAAELPPEVPPNLRKRVHRAQAGVATMLPALVGAALGISTVSLFFRGFSSDRLLTAVVQFLVLLAILIPTTYLVRRKYRPGTATACLASGLCPSCGYSLVGLAPQADGCVECPECSAAWRRPTAD